MLVTPDHERQENVAGVSWVVGKSEPTLSRATPEGAVNPEKARKPVPIPFPAQNISVYTISLDNVSDSLDAPIASKPCRRWLCGSGKGWLDGCCSGGSEKDFGNDKICHSGERRATSRKPK